LYGRRIVIEPSVPSTSTRWKPATCVLTVNVPCACPKSKMAEQSTSVLKAGSLFTSATTRFGSADRRNLLVEIA
jgi:hypothetical protein